MGVISFFNILKFSCLLREKYVLIAKKRARRARGARATDHRDGGGLLSMSERSLGTWRWPTKPKGSLRGAPATMPLGGGELLR